MCDERERLIEYVYEECTDPDRREVESHLQECAVCRAEIGGLRRVRQDLLAWDVPDRGSVWQPFAPARPVWSWRDVPTWALAAAATVMFAVGAAGGVVTHALVPHLSPGDVVIAAAPQEPVLTPASLSDMEARMLGMVRQELSALQPVSIGQPQQPDFSAIEARLLARMRAELGDLTPRRFGELEQYVDTIGRDLIKNTQDVRAVELQLTAVAANGFVPGGGLK